jgi:hypothetical protein
VNTFYLNIGLWHAGTKDEMMLAAALAAIEARVYRILRIALVRKFGEEPSLVIHGGTLQNRETLHNQVFAAACALNQDCIAVYWDSTQQGALIGPRSDKWPAFDLAYFNFL